MIINDKLLIKLYKNIAVRSSSIMVFCKFY